MKLEYKWLESRKTAIWQADGRIAAGYVSAATPMAVVVSMDDCPFEREPQQLGTAIRGALHQIDAALPVVIETRLDEIGGALFPPQVASISLGVLGIMGAMLSITGIFGMAAYSVGKRLRERLR